MYKYEHFIPENTAPKGAKKLGVYDTSGKRLMSIPLGQLSQPMGAKRYSFGLVSDTHICPNNSEGTTVSAKLEHAFSWFEEQGAVFVANCGDMTNIGFENPKGTYNPVEFAEYQRICNLHPNLPVYSVCGNHDSYNADIANYEEELIEYTGHGIRFTVEHDEDVFIFFGQPKSSVLYVDGSTTPVPELVWLQEQLSNNKDKRCFVFIHPYLTDDSGNPLGVHPTPIEPAPYVHNIITTALKNHGRAILFHGHSHFMPSIQEQDETTNYTDKNGFPSVHVSSLGWASYIDSNNEMQKDMAGGFGYLVDVYDDCIVINGRDFVRNQWAALGVFKIDTTLQTIEAGTFTDSTGTITLQGG